MSITTSFHHPRPSIAAGLAGLLRRIPRSVRVLALVLGAVFAAQQLVLALQTPGQAIRAALAGAAAEVQSPRVQPTDAVRRAILGHFRAYDATLDARAWPQVAVTLRGLDADTCRDVQAAARRIEGLVVVQLEGYRDAVTCRDSNDMTWRIMP
jgi:hypothetical protein